MVLMNNLSMEWTFSTTEHESLRPPDLPPKPYFNKQRIEQLERTLPISRRASHSTSSFPGRRDSTNTSEKFCSHHLLPYRRN